MERYLDCFKHEQHSKEKLLTSAAGSVVKDVTKPAPTRVTRLRVFTLVVTAMTAVLTLVHSYRENGKICISLRPPTKFDLLLTLLLIERSIQCQFS